MILVSNKIVKKTYCHIFKANQKLENQQIKLLAKIKTVLNINNLYKKRMVDV